jgi:hypothetical protein
MFECELFFSFDLKNLSTIITKICSCVKLLSKKEFETYEKQQQRMNTEVKSLDLSINNLKDQIKSINYNHDQHVEKLKKVQDDVYKIESVQIPTLNNRLNQLASKDELNSVRTDLEDKVNSCF